MWHTMSNMAGINFIYYANKSTYLESFYNKSWYDKVMMVSLLELLPIEAQKHHIGAVTRIFIMKILDVTYVEMLLLL